MTRTRSLANALYLECLAFIVTMFLAASDVGAEGGSDVHARKTSSVTGGITYANRSICYDNKKKEVRCTKEKAIIVGSVIGSIFVLLAALYLYATCSDRLKKRRRSRSAEETEPLSRGTGSTLDVEKGVSKAGDDSMHLDKSDGSSVYRTSSTVSDISGHTRPPGLT